MSQLANMNPEFVDDVSAVGEIDVVPHILEVICRTTGLGFSAIARVTESHWIACAVRDEIAFGLRPGGELVIETTICDEIRVSGKLVVFDDAETDEEFRDHPTPKRYGFRSYISVPIHRKDGQLFGTLCAIDPKPARVNNSETIQMFKLFANLISMHLDAQQRVTATEAALQAEQEKSQLRDQFIAVLGHDLRNPLGAISTGAELLAVLPTGNDANQARDIIRRSVTRMTELIDNILDFARGRLGGGFSMEQRAESNLESALRQVVTELQIAWPDRQVECEMSIDRSVKCNPARLGQMLSNILGNAFTYGDPSRPIRVLALSSENSFEMSVANEGKTIPEAVIGRLFQPFVRGDSTSQQQGLGLGLYIASEIARAHKGILKVTSANGETRFVFEMPNS